MFIGGWRRLCESGNSGWLEVAQSIREGKLMRAEAYARIRSLKMKKELPHMGPAFFTKLNYFLKARAVGAAGDRLQRLPVERHAT